MATSTTAFVEAAAGPLPLTARDRALALRRRLLPLAAAWALLVTLPLYWVVVGELADGVTRHGTRRFTDPSAPLLAAAFLLVCLAPCVASAGLSLLAWLRGPETGRRRVLLLLPGGLAGGVIGWCADQVERGPVLAATAVLVAVMLGSAAVVTLARAARSPATAGDPSHTPAATSRQRASTSE